MHVCLQSNALPGQVNSGILLLVCQLPFAAQYRKMSTIPATQIQYHAWIAAAELPDKQSLACTLSIGMPNLAQQTPFYGVLESTS